MAKVNRSKDCGNSPKNAFAQEVAIAIEKGDSKALDKVLVEGATCTLENGQRVSRSDFLDALNRHRAKPTVIDVDRVVTHGRAGAVDGASRLGNARLRRFCHVLHFANTKGDKVAHISSYGQSTSGESRGSLELTLAAPE